MSLGIRIRGALGDEVPADCSQLGCRRQKEVSKATYTQQNSLAVPKASGEEYPVYLTLSFWPAGTASILLCLISLKLLRLLQGLKLPPILPKTNKATRRSVDDYISEFVYKGSVPLKGPLFMSTFIF